MVLVTGAARRSRAVELRFAVNCLAHYVLSRALLPLLLRSAPSRIVNVSSAGQAPVDFDDPMLTRRYSGTYPYGQSKLAQILFTLDLAEELSGRGVMVTALHPATYMRTEIVSAPASSLEEGVEATVRLMAGEEVAGVTGAYFDGMREARAHGQACDECAREAAGAVGAPRRPIVAGASLPGPGTGRAAQASAEPRPAAARAGRPTAPPPRPVPPARRGPGASGRPPGYGGRWDLAHSRDRARL